MSKSKTTAAPALTYERVRIDSLSEDPANVRLHPERNLEAIKASLRASGQQKPIVVDRRGIVIAGNGTLRAARALGWEEIDVVRSNLEGPAAVAFAIADNRTAELAEWDPAALQRTMEALRESGINTEDTGFTAAELAGIVQGLGGGWEPIEEQHEGVVHTPTERVTVLIYDIPARAAIRKMIADTIAANFDVPGQCEMHND